MTEIKKLHHKAMELAQAAEVAKVRGNLDAVGSLLEQAYSYEKQAAQLCVKKLQLEPTRSVLHRSAASLALECGHLREAEQLIATALSGNPPEEIAEELRDLLEQVYFQRHLDIRGVTLSQEEMQLSLAGPAVGFGIVLSEDFVDRVQAVERLVFRTAERFAGLDYREQGSPDRRLKENLEVFLAVPRPASYSVTLKIGRPDRQRSFPGWEDLNVEEIIDDIMTNLERLDAGNDEAIKHSIPNQAYRRNFVALGKRIAPDGGSIRQVGLTVIRAGNKRDLALKKPASQLDYGAPGTSNANGSRRIEQVEGTLRFADGLSANTGRLKLVDRLGAEHLILVPQGMMNDIVRPLWNDHVLVKGKRDKRGRIVMRDIRKSDRPLASDQT